MSRWRRRPERSATDAVADATFGLGPKFTEPPRRGLEGLEGCQQMIDSAHQRLEPGERRSLGAQSLRLPKRFADRLAGPHPLHLDFGSPPAGHPLHGFPEMLLELGEAVREGPSGEARRGHTGGQGIARFAEDRDHDAKFRERSLKMTRQPFPTEHSSSQTPCGAN